jgi:hypothetical protein
MGIAQARKEAAALRVRISGGEDPALIRRRKKLEAVAAISVRKLIDDYRNPRRTSDREQPKAFTGGVVPVVPVIPGSIHDGERRPSRMTR